MWRRASNYDPSLTAQPGAQMWGLHCDGSDGRGFGFRDWQIRGAVAELPPPDPAEILRGIMARVPVASPTLQFGPDRSLIAVKVPVWIWTDDPVTLTDSETDRGLTVTVTAELDSLELGMGEPDVRGTFNERKPEATIHCDTVPTTGPPEGNTRETVPPCGYTYIWRSLKDRTDDTCRWPVTITANWSITWTASNGESGELELTRNGAAALLVREWRTQLVSPDYRHDPEEWLALQRETPPCE